MNPRRTDRAWWTTTGKAEAWQAARLGAGGIAGEENNTDIPAYGTAGTGGTAQ